MTEHNIQSLLDSLSIDNPPGVFNPWSHYDEENDIDQRSPSKRRSNLYNYLCDRTNARYLLVAEALGYQGGHFSGIAMTSERIILGHKASEGITTNHVCSNSALHRSSKVITKEKGYSEPTATIVWRKIISLGHDPKNFILWNAFPWHPYDPEKGKLSNRPPTESELVCGKRILEYLIGVNNFEKILAIGKSAQQQLQNLDITAPTLRHPANGGASIFREQLEAEIGRIV